MDVRRGNLGGQRHASTVGEDVTLDAGLASVCRIGSCRIAALWCLDDGAIQRRPLPLDATHVVVEADASRRGVGRCRPPTTLGISRDMPIPNRTAPATPSTANTPQAVDDAGQDLVRTDRRRPRTDRIHRRSSSVGRIRDPRCPTGQRPRSLDRASRRGRRSVGHLPTATWRRRQARA